MKYRAVFFDAGETLVYPHPSFPELLSLTLREEDLDVAPETIRDRLYVVAEIFTRATQERELWSTSPERSRRFWGKVYRTLLAELGLPFPDRVAERLYRVFTDLSNYRLFPDVVPTLKRLRTDGLALGLISNFEEWLERLLERLDVTPYFDVRVISGVEGVEKPDPRIFELALERAGVTPDRSVYVGDNLVFDVAPATEVGMLGVLLDRRGRYPDAECVRITSLEELPGVLAA